MCVVKVDPGHLDRARECLLKVSKLALSEPYIPKHLKIVGDRLNMLSQQHRKEKNKRVALFYTNTSLSCAIYN